MTVDISPFRGLFPAVITPMTQEDELCEPALRKVLAFNMQAGAHGFWIAGGSGESVLLDDEENRRIATLAVEECQGRAVTIMHVGAPTTRRAARLAEHAGRAGVDAICCVPPFFYGRSPDEIAEHYRVVAAAADVPLFVYNLPGSTGVEITLDLMKTIQDCVPQLAGLKHSSLNLPLIRQFADLGLACFTGSCALMLPALTVGACGCVDGPPNVAPEAWVQIWRAWERGDLREAEEAQVRARKIIEVCVTYGGPGYHAVLKAMISARLGVDCGNPRRPALPLTTEQRDHITARTAEVGLDRVDV